MEMLRQALELEVSNSQSYVALGAALTMTVKFKVGIERMRFGIKISPRDRRIGYWGGHWASPCWGPGELKMP